MPLIPLLVVLAGLAFFLSRRQNKTIQYEAPRVVVKGHTYSDSMEGPVEKRRRVEVRNACFVGSGYVGALTAIVLASKNPHIHFFVVDYDPARISAWNSESLPVLEPGLEEVLMGTDGQGLKIEDGGQVVMERSQRLRNLTFTTDVDGCLTAADMVFLCVDNDLSESDSDDQPHLIQLEAAIRSIAQVSTGHKIIVQKSTAPCGIVHWIGKELKTSRATFDVLSNPEFITPGTAMRDLLYPHRVVIGHVVSEGMASAEAVSALKRLYTPWIPEDRIVTTDAWSSELSKIAVNAIIAQRVSSLQSLRLICEKANANMDDICQITGLGEGMGVAGAGEAPSQADVLCLVYLARELGLWDVAEYWRAVNRVNGQRRIAQSNPVEEKEMDLEQGAMEEGCIQRDMVQHDMIVV